MRIARKCLQLTIIMMTLALVSSLPLHAAGNPSANTWYDWMCKKYGMCSGTAKTLSGGTQKAKAHSLKNNLLAIGAVVAGAGLMFALLKYKLGPLWYEMTLANLLKRRRARLIRQYLKPEERELIEKELIAAQQIHDPQLINQRLDELKQQKNYQALSEFGQKVVQQWFREWYIEWYVKKIGGIAIDVMPMLVIERYFFEHTLYDIVNSMEPEMQQQLYQLIIKNGLEVRNYEENPAFYQSYFAKQRWMEKNKVIPTLQEFSKKMFLWGIARSLGEYGIDDPQKIGDLLEEFSKEHHADDMSKRIIAEIDRERFARESVPFISRADPSAGGTPERAGHLFGEPYLFIHWSPIQDFLKKQLGHEGAIIYNY